MRVGTGSLLVCFNPQEGQCYVGGKEGKEVWMGVEEELQDWIFFYPLASSALSPGFFFFLSMGRERL